MADRAPAVCQNDAVRQIPENGRVLIDVERDQVIKLNRVGTEMWELLAQGLDSAHITDVIAQKYNVNTERVAADLSTFKMRLSALGLRPMKLGSQSFESDESGLHRSYPWYGQSPTALPKASALAVLAAVLGLLLVDVTLLIFKFKRLCAWVGAWPQRQGDYGDHIIGEVCAAVQQACVWYPRKSLCLQRSAVTTCLLRMRGVPARMMIGVKAMPLLAHAWVDVNGSVVNDWPKVQTFYTPVLAY